MMDVMDETHNQIDLRKGTEGGPQNATASSASDPAENASGKKIRRLKIGDCGEDPQGMTRTASGALHHKIAPWLNQRLRQYYRDSNIDLFEMLGRDLEW